MIRHRYYILMLALLSICFSAGHLSAATPQQYDAALAAIQKSMQGEVNVLDNGDVPTAEKPASVAARVLARVRAVQLPDGDVYLIHTDAFVRVIAAVDSEHNSDRKESRYKELIRHTVLIRQNLDGLAAASPIQHGPGLPTAQLRTILSGADYQSEPLPDPSSFERELDIFLKWLAKIFNPKTPNMPTPHISFTFIKALLIILATALFAFVVWLIVRLITQSGAVARKSLVGDTEAAMVEARDTDSLLSLAETFASKGDYRTAFRLVYIATLVGLDSGGILRFDRSRTNWEYLRALRDAGRGDLYQSMVPLTRDFDRVWYGYSSADAGDYRRALDYYHSVLTKPDAVVGARA